MSYARKGLRGLGLCFLAVLGLMAFAVSSAQGQLAGKFLDTTGELAVGTTLTGTNEVGVNGTLLVAKLNMAIECTVTDVIAGTGVVTAKLSAGPPHVAGEAHATLKFLNCVVKSAALVTLGACKIGEGNAITTKVKLLAMLASAAHAEVPFVLAVPLEILKDANARFTTLVVENETGKFCSLAGTYSITGSLAFKVLAGNVNPQLLIPYANQALLGDAILLGTNPAVLDASFIFEITTAGLAGAPFGVC